MAAYYANPSVLAHTNSLQPYGHLGEQDDQNQSTSIYNLPTDSEGEAEVDELESDSEDEHGAGASTNGQKKGGRRVGERAPGTTLLPASRIEGIIHADGVTGSLSMSKEAVFVLSIATEEFLKRVVQAGHRHASASRRNTVNYTDMSSSTQQYQEFMFLQGTRQPHFDTIPEPIPLSIALDRRKEKEKGDLEANPAMSSAIQPHISASTPISQANGRKAKVRINGREKGSTSMSMSASASSGADYRRDMMGDDPPSGHDLFSVPMARSSNGRIIRSSRAAHQEIDFDEAAGSAPNGSAHASDQVESWSSPASPRHPSVTRRPSYGFHNSPPHPFNPGWSGQYTGPASGFLQESQSAFGRIAQNPGRTIYSQQSRSENASYR
ncbi:hypothetical protein F5I97DRAFT_1937606 [Phlebopus sp. FC_14]|nr:hypothetical protein F5I97DRAFT_1937606 [Phlebopus sp. FC_14]